MVWQENLLNNILVLSILLGLFIIIYCKVTKRTLTEAVKELNELIFGVPETIE